MLIGLMSMGTVMAQSTDLAANKSNAPVVKAERAGPGGDTYFVMAKHTPEQCMAMMDEMKAKGDKYLSKFKFGCMSGDHAAYSFVEAASADEARNMLPLELQVNAKVVKVDVMTVKGIGAMHKDMK